MEHRGVEYTVVQTINPYGWKWSFQREGRAPKIGIAGSRTEAVLAARLAINRDQFQEEARSKLKSQP
jgi:hypothetical protein